MIALTTDLKRLGGVKAPAGFADRVLAQAGVSDSYAPFETVLGEVFVAWNRQGVSAAMRAASAAEFEAWFRKEVGRPLSRAVAPPELAAKIQDELNGKRRMRFDLRGLTPFEQAVLRKTREIRRGEVRPYGWVAREIGHPAAVRAVGTALPATAWCAPTARSGTTAAVGRRRSVQSSPSRAFASRGFKRWLAPAIATRA